MARRRVAELQLSNSFELAKQYLESARNYTQNVYLPLAVEVYKLQDAFLTYNVMEQMRKGGWRNRGQLPRDRLESDCWVFIGAVGNLFSHGGGAVITIRLEEDVTSFMSFLRESVTAEQVVKTRSSLGTVWRSGLAAFALVTPILGIAAS